MKHSTGREIRRLILAATVMAVALIIGVTAYLIVDATQTTNANIERNKEMILEQEAFSLEGIAGGSKGTGGEPRILATFSQDCMLDTAGGYAGSLSGSAAHSAVMMNPLEAASTIDRTAEMRAMNDYFVGQLNNVIVRMSAAAVIGILFILLVTTLGLRYVSRRYVVNPT